jgi:hypothetical protein
MPKQKKPGCLRVKGETLYDTDNKVIASDGDEIEEGAISEECVAWLLAEGKGEWVLGELDA